MFKTSAIPLCDVGILFLGEEEFLMEEERFKANIFERVIIHAFTPYEYGVYLMFEAVNRGLKAGYEYNWKHHFYRKRKDYEAFVRSRDNPGRHEKIRQEMEKYPCGRIAIGTALMLGRV